MKRNYVKPKTRVITIETSSIMASSGVVNDCGCNGQINLNDKGEPSSCLNCGGNCCDNCRTSNSIKMNNIDIWEDKE